MSSELNDHILCLLKENKNKNKTKTTCANTEI